MVNDVARANVEEVVKGGIPLNYESFKHAWIAKYGTETDGSEVQAIFLSILDQANSYRLASNCCTSRSLWYGLSVMIEAS